MNTTTIKRWLSYLVPGTLPLIIFMGIWMFAVEGTGTLTSSHLADLGGLASNDTLSVSALKVFTAMFVHASAAHFISNAILLYIGSVLLQMIPVRYWMSGVAFLLSGLISNLAWLGVMLGLHGQQVLVGASGGLYGVFGCAEAVLASLVIKRITKTDDPKFGTYGCYGYKLIATTLLVAILLSGNINAGDVFTTLVHTVGLITGLIYGRVVYLSTFTGRSYQDAVRAQFTDAQIENNPRQHYSRMKRFH